MSHTLLSAGAGRLSLWLGGATLALGTFVRITRELIEGDVSAMDSAILLAVAKKRIPWLTITALDVTALGSITLVVLFSVFTLVVLLVLRDQLGALQLLAASVGAGILTLVAKNLIERIRPGEAQQLIVVSGFSYPSGHSLSTSALYLTIAIIAGRYVQHPGRKSHNCSGCIGGADHDWHLTRVPWRSLSDRRRERHLTRSGLGATARRVLHTRWSS